MLKEQSNPSTSLAVEQIADWLIHRLIEGEELLNPRSSDLVALLVRPDDHREEMRERYGRD